MSSILTNNSSMVALETLRNINRNLESVQSEISTGKKVSSAKDNSAIWAISTVMSTDVESFKQISDSLNKGSSTVGVARAASEQITGLLQDMKNLIVDAQQDLNADDRSKIQADVDAIRTSIGNIVNAAQFNGQNLLKGGASVSVLASLDRGADGSVSATSITVARNDLQTTGAVPAAAKEATDAGYASTEDTATVTDVAKEAGAAGTITASADGDMADTDTKTLTIKGGAISAGDKFTFDLNGTEITYTAAAGDTINDVAAELRTKIDDAGLNLAAAAGDDAADPLTDDATIELTATGAVTFDQADIVTTFEQSQIDEDDSIEVSFSGGTISTGDTFTLGGVTVTAAEGETINDVVERLADDLEAEGVENLVVEYTAAEDPATGSATITLTATGGDAVFSLADLGSTNVAVAAGGLGAIADLSVSTSADATTALNTVEALLDTAISAATSFGSAQKQIEGQAEFVQTLIGSMTAGIGTMVDADIEAASARLQALQVQQQLGVQALSIANSAPQQLLALFR